jgi:hypothetical protein
MNTPSELLEIARQFNMTSVVDRYCKEKHETRERANIIADELRHFLILCVLNTDKGYAIRDPIDEMWHTFIIFTKDYFKFCLSIGKPYLHHAPTEESDKKIGANARLESYKELLEDYEKTFGYQAPKDIWPEPGTTIPMKGPDCGKDCSYYPPCCNK